MPESGPRFKDSSGADLLAAIMQRSAAVRERHDSLEFLNHAYLRHTVRLVVDIGGEAGRYTQSTPPGTEARALVEAPGTLRTWYGRVVVPLAALDRHSRATTHVTNEAGEIVPLFTTDELHLMLGGGLVSYAARALGYPPSTELSVELRKIPSRAARELQPAAVDTHEAADKAFDTIFNDLLTYPDGFELLRSSDFRAALEVITRTQHLVVALDPEKGPVRVLAYEFMRPLTRRRTRASELNSLERRWLKLRRLWTHSGTIRATVSLGPIGDCGSYQLDADAPFDTWFASATLTSGAPGDTSPSDVDTSLFYRLHSWRRTHVTDALGELEVDLRCVFTGIARTSVFASAFLTLCCLLGTLRVLLAHDHTFLASDTDAGASVLLLFPGVAATFLAAPAAHTLTATMQFPLRFIMWAMCAASFALAAATAIRLSGTLNIALWLSITGMTAAGALILRHRGKALAAL